MRANSDNDVNGWSSRALDREIVIARVVDAGRVTTFRAWTDPEQIVQWFGPEGFCIETHEMDIRTGGRWRFEMFAPDGTRFSNRMVFLQIAEPEIIEIVHGADTDDDPDIFRMRVSFDAQDNGNTVVTLRQLHPTPERRDIVVGFGAVEYGAQTLDKLAFHVAEKAARKLIQGV